MRYRLYVYKSSSATSDAAAVSIVNAEIRQWRGSRETDNDAIGLMRDFDAVVFKLELEEKVGEKARIELRFLGKQMQAPFLYIATTYESVQEVLPYVHAMTAEKGLVLYDAEKRRSFYKELIDNTFITHKVREQAFKQAILNRVKPLWDLKKIGEYESRIDRRSEFVVTIRKEKDLKFEARVESFYKLLQENLLENEKLICENHCFTISGERYYIIFCFEGYKKKSNRIGWYGENKGKTKLIERMGASEAYKWVEENCTDTEKDDISKRMNFREMVESYPNPADRYVESVNITKRLRKETFDIRYSGMGYYGSEILFHVVPDSFYMDDDIISVLKIEEESATFIMPFIADVYPYIYGRYYLTENYIPLEMVEDIVRKIAAAKEMILFDTFNPELTCYINKFNLFVLANNEENNFWETGDGFKIKKNKVQFLYEHRYEAARVYDMFLDWAGVQLKMYNYSADGRMFNIQGT